MNKLEDLEVSNIGLGTYLGPSDVASDARLLAVLRRGGELGINFVDTAANYRAGQSERVIGAFLRGLPNAEADRWVVATKAGFLPIDPERAKGLSKKDYFTKAYIETGIVRPDWIFGNWQCFHPRYLEWQTERSLAALGRRQIDIFYFHNPESALLTATRREFEAIMRQAFRWGRAMVREGCIRYLGIATWGGLLGLSDFGSLDLLALTAWAREEGAGESFRFIQAPVSAALPQAFLQKSQCLASGKAVSLVRCAAGLGQHVIASAPLLNGKLLEIPCPQELQDALGLYNLPQVYVEFARSAPGVGATLLGTLSVAHLEEVAELLKRCPVHDDLLRFLKGEARA